MYSLWTTQRDSLDVTGFKSACINTDVRTAGPSAINRPLNSCLPLPGLVLEAVDRPEGSAEKIDKVLLKT
jgi:hypothetical protein